MRTRRRTPSLIGVALTVVLLLRSEPTRAFRYVAGVVHPDIVWLEVGFTSERHVFLGTSFESVLGGAGGGSQGLPIGSWTAGVEVSPYSGIAPVRLFATINAAINGSNWLTSSNCDAFLVGASGGPVVTIGPHKIHPGLRLGARLAFVPLAYSSGSEPVVGLSYGFSWLPTVARVHDFGVESGLTWASHGDCESD